MKIKTKITLGVGMLFALIILLSIVGISSIHALKKDANYILTDNYKTLSYAKNMLRSLDSKQHETFALNLDAQSQNITELGESEITDQIKRQYTYSLNNPEDTENIIQLRNNIIRLIEINMEAIHRKSESAEQTADRAILSLAISGSLCFLIAFGLLINLPANIANPIKELTHSIKQIAAENYSQRVNFEEHTEFGQLARSFNTMAEKLEEFNNSNLSKLLMEKNKIEAIINNVHDPLIGLDENLNIIFANKEAVRITGLSRSEVLGLNAKDLAVSNDLIRLLIRDLVAGLEQKHTDLKHLRIYTDNKEGYFDQETIHISLKPTGEDVEQHIGHLIVLRNVTSYKELDTAKTNFIATISHELKTPISSMQMTLQLLEKADIGLLNAEQKNLLDGIRDDSNRLLKITGELLKLTQVESGNIQLSIFPADPQEIASYAIQATRVQADQKFIKYNINYALDLPKISADAEKTAWVLTNLLSNGIRYSHENSSIELTVLQVSNQVHFVIKDFGQGIAPEYKEKIFERYFRIPGSAKEGNGLGLA